MPTGVRFRVTEEYDEDSPFSRPPSWRPPSPDQDPPPAPGGSAVADPTSPGGSTHTDASVDAGTAEEDTTGNGLHPASGTHTHTDDSGPESAPDTEDQLQRSALSGIPEQQSTPSVGRGQVYSNEKDTPKKLPAHIEVASHPDSDQPASTEQMDPVHQKPGVRRTLDGSGHVAPDRDAGQQGLSPPPSQAQETPQGELGSEGGSGQDRPWWEPAVTAATAAVASVSEGVSGAAESVKTAVSGSYRAVSRGPPDQQPGEDRLY